ncbi:cellulase N-terminal Ig-like domain-containing protein [uncultured Clostridium sp.]|uniref:cellulase N-terminal Ig-like domain-containing protein n=1 Tax=uncultured Clostridium sp. TaxID=59620 RepID=UPI0025FCD14C|nr:cellulase N-terminal Ig-like domain-containing protein [uncultured Clostridium sp.]
MNTILIGYKPNQVKKAVFKMPVDAEKFRVVNDITGETVYEGNLEGEIYDKSAGENDCFGYFSELKTPGHIELKQMV